MRSVALSVCLFVYSTIATADPWTPYFQFDVFGHAEPVPIRAFIDDWKAPLQSGSDALTHDRIEVGVRYGAWALGYVQAYEYELKASRDTVEFYHQARNKVEFEAGRRYQLSLDAYHSRRQGLKLGYQHETPTILLRTGLNYWKGQKLIDGSIRGEAVTLGGGNYDYSAAVDYYYSEDRLFDRSVPPPNGEGYSVDLDARWQWRPEISLAVEMRDIAGVMHWKAAPQTIATASSDNKSFDEDGFVVYAPLLSGIETQRNFRQRIHPKGRLTAQWDFSESYALGTALRLTEVQTYASLSLDKRWDADLILGAEILPLQRAAGVKLQYGGLELAWLSDKLKVDDAHLLQVRIAGAWRF